MAQDMLKLVFLANPDSCFLLRTRMLTVHITLHITRVIQTEIKSSALKPIKNTIDREQKHQTKQLKQKKIFPIKSTVTVYKDPSANSESPCTHATIETSTQTEAGECFCDCHTKTEEQSAEDEAFELMVKSEPNESYWLDVAERRREALAEALDENFGLHKRVEDLEEQNRSLSELAGHAEYFANLLKEVTGDDSICSLPEKTEEKTAETSENENTEEH